MSRGMTILELLAAVVLMSAVMVAGVSWLRIAASDTAVAGQRLGWSIAARAVFARIEEDIQTGDLSGEEPKAQVGKDGTLRVRTRVRGPILCVYRWDESTGVLWRDEVAASGGVDSEPAGDPRPPRRLLAELAGAEFTDNRKAKTLTVALTSRRACTWSRSYRLP
jgi:hypothetical protein